MGIRSGHVKSGLGDGPGELGALTAHLACYVGWPEPSAVKGEEIPS